MLNDRKAADLKRQLSAQRRSLCAELYQLALQQEQLAKAQAAAEAKLAATGGALEIVELALAENDGAGDGEAAAD